MFSAYTLCTGENRSGELGNDSTLAPRPDVLVRLYYRRYMCCAVTARACAFCSNFFKLECVALYVGQW